jgi:hypothetical protein
MSCHYLRPGAKPPSSWHRLWCARCRAAYAADRAIAYDLKQWRRECPPASALEQTMAALDLAALGRARKRLAWRTGGPLLLGIALVVGGIGWWWQEMNADPNVVVPTPALPANNAFPDFVRAGKMLHENPERKAFCAELSKRYHSRLYDQMSPEERARFLRLSAPALATLRSALKRPYHEPPARSFTALFPHYPQYRELARALVVEAEDRAYRKDFAGAMESCLDAMEMGEKIPKGSVLIGKMVGIACQTIGLRKAWEVVPQLSASEARQAALRLEAINALHVSFAEALQEEKWCGQASLLQIMRQANWMREMARNLAPYSYDPNNDPSVPVGKTFAMTVFQVGLLSHSKRRILENYTRSLDQAIAFARQPYDPQRSAPPLSEDGISRILLPAFASGYFTDAYSRAENNLLLAALALRAYRDERGRCPEMLAELVPNYLKAIPEDPFAPIFAKPRLLSYRREGSDYRLYSVGPDGVNDGGIPVDNQARPRPGQSVVTSREQRYHVYPDSKGDVVVGLNVGRDYRLE